MVLGSISTLSCRMAFDVCSGKPWGLWKRLTPILPLVFLAPLTWTINVPVPLVCPVSDGKDAHSKSARIAESLPNRLTLRVVLLIEFPFCFRDTQNYDWGV